MSQTFVLALSMSLALQADQSARPTGLQEAGRDGIAASILRGDGLSPPDEVIAAGRELRRVSFSDGYTAIGTVEIERRRDGTVTLLVASQDRRIAPVQIPAERWQWLVEHDRDAFEPRIEPSIGSTARFVCHSNFMVFGSFGPDGVRTSRTSLACAQPDPDQLAYASAVARFAVEAQGNCTFEGRYPLADLQRCTWPKLYPEWYLRRP